MRKMKDSGIEWIGQIPEDWEINKTKYLFNVVNGATPKSGDATFWDGEIMWITPADYKTEDKYILCSKRYITKEGVRSCGTSIVPEGSIIISNRAPIGLVALAGKELCTNQGCKALVKNSNISELYYYYYFSVMESPLNMLGKGTTFLELSSEELKEFCVLLPTITEQQRIAEYLDKKCAEIDSIIKAKEKTNELLKEARQSIIYEAVTKGLDKSVPMKDSGIEWIGQIPQGWDVKKLRYIFNFNTGISITRAQLIDEGIPCINYGEIHSKYGFDLDMSRDELKCVDLSFIEKNESAIVQENDFVFCDTSEDIEGSGNCVYISNTNGQIICAGSHTIVAKPKIAINSRYLAYLFSTNAWRAQIRSVVYGIKVFSITQSILKTTKAIIPPIQIQSLICNYLDKKCAEIDSVINANNIIIQKLKEYKQSVIYEAVTGKIEV
jgi:type I restriction enzyme S subunit